MEHRKAHKAVKFFKAYKAKRLATPIYFIESTAPYNVDDADERSMEQEFQSPRIGPTLATQLHDANLTPFRDSNDAVKEIAQILASGTNPNLVIMVHGFNNPERNVLEMYAAAATAVDGDPVISARRGLVCVGYRWPSESMGAPIGSSWRAMAALPRRVFLLGLVLVAASLPLFYWVWQTAKEFTEHGFHLSQYGWPFLAHASALAGWILLGLILMAILLRAIVYFRDNYRATNYGVPDLIQVIRAIDGEIVRLYAERGVSKPPRNVELSFIGHSMGGFVVTNTIRTLSDVFAVPVLGLNSYGAEAPNPRLHGGEGPPPDSHDGERPIPRGESPWDEIGNVFRLMRFVLASPDIPAEALLSSRSNFLASSLVRFREAYLFSNEGDEVLRQISTLANYFVFPTKSSNYGFRLGNTEILSQGYGFIGPGLNGLLQTLRVGNLTLQELYDALGAAEASRHEIDQPTRSEARLPEVFTYFDCTDYVDVDNNGVSRPLLTFAACNKSKDANAALSFRAHLRLLWAYVSSRQPNVHGGYFEGRLSQQLIYRLACLGYVDTVAAFGGGPALDKGCKQKQIRVLLSPHLRRVPIPPPPTHQA